MLVNTKRIIKSGFINFWRSGVVALSSVVVLTVALFVIGGLYLGQALLNSSLETLKEKVDISVSFYPDVAESEVLTFKKQIESLSGVKEVSYSSREAEIIDFRERNADNSIIIQSLEEIPNPLGARLNIKAIDPSHYENIASFLKADNALSATEEDKFIYDINYRKLDIDLFIAFTAAVRRIGSAIALVLILIAVLAVFSTVSLAIHVSREEIAVMRLVGADNRYIRGPFIIEGAIAGLLASLLAVMFLYPATIWVRQATAAFPDRFDLVSYYLNHFSTLFFLILGFGLILSVIASSWAVRKYLKV
ncbi:MAG: FtsX-like permease family protein [Candidatus Vogelbacteria bacterium]|nr:FtsX-like permease family protein [Candidatus Vogelbacteria bacterium]